MQRVPTCSACFVHLLHQPRPLDHLGEAGIILDVGGDGELAARLQAEDQDRLQIGARGIDRGGVAGGAGADDEEFGAVIGSWCASEAEHVVEAERPPAPEQPMIAEKAAGRVAHDDIGIRRPRAHALAASNISR